MPRKLLILPFLITLITACSKTSSNTAPLHIVRLDIAASQPDSSFTETEQAAFNAWMDIIDASYSKEDYAKSAAMTAFGPIVLQELPALDSVEMVLGSALPQGFTPIGIISPYNQSVITHPNGFLFIALNHYLGTDNPIYAGRFPEHERRRKTINRLPIDAVEAAIASAHPDSLPSDATLLNHLLYHGALLQATLESLPENTTEASLLAMTPEEYAWCIENEANIWNSIVTQGLLYSSDRQMIKRLLSPAPASPMISANAPGQTTLFTALKITQSYLNNSDVNTAENLLKTSYYNSNQSLIDSKYSPAYARK